MVSETEMRRTFNLGVGMILVADSEGANRIRRHLKRKGEGVPVIGQVVPGKRRVVFGRQHA